MAGLESLSPSQEAEADEMPDRESSACVLSNQYLTFALGSNGRNLQFTEKRTGRNYCSQGSAFASVKKAGKEYSSTAVANADGRLTIDFADSGVSALIHAAVEKQYLLFEVVSVTGEGVDELTFVDVPLTLNGAPEEPFAGCALALNLQTNITELPQANSRLRAMCYPRFGFAGAKAAIIGCPQSRLREVMQKVVSEAQELPHSPIGGPWALEPAINHGSYLLVGEVSEQQADGWIRLAQSLGMNQIDFMSAFRYGDFLPNPKTYPHGGVDVKGMINKLNAAKIAAGLHTYSFFIDKQCPLVTPAPDPRLAKDAAFTLSEPLTMESTTVPVVESTQAMSTVTGFFVRNSVTLQIDDELITYSGIGKQPPFAFTGCTRGAYGTIAAAHSQGAKVYHLKECFGLFVPDADSTLLEEVAANMAKTFNEYGFSMIYLDALDGEDVLGGQENSWHYGSKFVFEIWKRLKRPALGEMSTFHHHLWYVRSRIGAWDVPRRAYKMYVDVHSKANQANQRMFLPSQLGWWAFHTWAGPQVEPTYPDDIEYLMCKCLGSDTGISLEGIDPDSFTKVQALPRLASIMKRYEDLRHSNRVPESVKSKLREPGEEFTLVGSLKEGWQFQPTGYMKHRVEGMDGFSDNWRVTNKFGSQPLRLRIEALMAAAPYDAPDSVSIADFIRPDDFPGRATAPGVTGDLQASKAEVKAGAISGVLTASNTQTSPSAAWTKVEKTFSPALNLSAQQALGVWIYGDGQGETLNLQLKSPEYIVAGIGDHYIIVDFKGWRYFELIEPEGKRWADYTWPYGGIYSIYQQSVDYSHVESFGLWYNNLPPGKTISCYVSPIKALPLVKTKLTNPAITVGGASLSLPCEVESGCYLEFNSQSDCKLYGPQGELIQEVTPQGEVPVLKSGENQIGFRCDAPNGVSARALVTVISRGKPLT